jgi:transcriptional antiterminator NusG
MQVDLKLCTKPTNHWGSEGEAMLNAASTTASTARATQENSSTDVHWYAVATRSRHEKMVRDRLDSIGIEPFLPLRRRLSQWSDRRVLTLNPLFPGYCFARFSMDNCRAVIQTPGVVKIVGAVMPEYIPDEEVAVLRKLTDSDRAVEAFPYFTVGHSVEVVRGPFIGLRGQLVRKSNHNCLVIRVHLIGQAATVHIHADEVIPLL